MMLPEQMVLPVVHDGSQSVLSASAFKLDISSGGTGFAGKSKRSEYGMERGAE